jgi:patatin-like phospholipase/acyl hydrolase
MSNPFDDILDDLLAAEAEIGEEIVARVQDDCSVDVEILGETVIRSKPGEHPRRETGDLYNSFKTHTTVDGGTVATVVDSDIWYAVNLENVMDRPIFTGKLDEYEPLILDRHVRAIEGKT